MSGSGVIHSDELPWESGGQGDLFAHRRRALASAAGGQGLGCSMIELDPGKTAWPFHFHCGNEEAIYVLAGEGTLRLGATRVRVRAGDYVALPPGPDDAHQLTNTGSEVVRYLVISTMVAPDVCVYPDSDKVGVVGALTDDHGQPRQVVTYPADAEVPYWEGEAVQQQEPESEVDPAAAREAREAEIQQMVQNDLDALKAKLAAAGTDASETTAPDSGSTRDGAAAAASAQQDDDLEALKRKLDG